MNWIVCSVLISVHVLFNLERYLLNTWKFKWEKSWLRKSKILKIGYMVLILCSTKEKYIFWLNWYITLCGTCVYLKQLIYTERETREPYLCFGWHLLYPFLPTSNFSFTHLYFKMLLERFLNDPTPNHLISSLFYCHPHPICHPCPTPKILIIQQ